jgi:hypothetical protein
VATARLGRLLPAGPQRPTKNPRWRIVADHFISLSKNLPSLSAASSSFSSSRRFISPQVSSSFFQSC